MDLAKRMITKRHRCSGWPATLLAALLAASLAGCGSLRGYSSVVVTPAAYASGNAIFPYADART